MSNLLSNMHILFTNTGKHTVCQHQADREHVSEVMLLWPSLLRRALLQGLLLQKHPPPCNLYTCTPSTHETMYSHWLYTTFHCFWQQRRDYPSTRPLSLQVQIWYAVQSASLWECDDKQKRCGVMKECMWVRQSSVSGCHSQVPLNACKHTHIGRSVFSSVP